MPDLALFNTADGGDIKIENGVETMSLGYEEAVYLSLFGGNEDDGGQPATAHHQWWGNLSEPLPERTYRSETQYLLRALPATSANLKKVQDSVTRDLAWLLDTETATQVSALARIPALNTIAITISLTIDGRKLPDIVIQRPWGVAA